MHNNQSAITPQSPDLCVFIGRFQPLHAGHCLVIKEGLSRAKFMVVLVGSANEPRSVRNPFTTAERIKMIEETFNHDPRLIVLPLEDSDYNINEWLDRTHQTVEKAWSQIVAKYPEAPSAPTVSLIGHAKDATSYYLNLFPGWGSIDVPQQHIMCATTLRRELFGDYEMFLTDLLTHEGKSWPLEDQIDRYTAKARKRAEVFMARQRALNQVQVPHADVPDSVLNSIQSLLDDGAEYRKVCAEYLAVAKNRFIWRHAPYPPICQAADALVVQSGRVLLIKRNSYPGKGLWALPGGYVEEFEEFIDAAFREMDEETSLEVPRSVLLDHLKGSARFASPHRSARGRIVTEAFLFHLDKGPTPKTKQVSQDDDEAQDIAWKLISELRREEMFEDHYAIIKKKTAGL